MKNILLTGFVLFLFSACNKNEEESLFDVTGDGNTLARKEIQIQVPAGAPLTKSRVDEIVMSTLHAQHDFRWEMVDFLTLWSAIQYGDQTVAIGYKPTGTGDISDIIHQVNPGAGVWKATHDALLAFIKEKLEESSGRSVDLAALMVEDDPVLPIISLRLTDKNVLTALANLENVRYIEPLDYWPGEEADRSTSGCGASSTALNSADYSTVTPGCKLPWNYSLINVDDAWNYAQGSGITIGVIDAGISSTQFLLNSGFNDGDSNVGRYITTSYTYGTSAYTTCTHGTSMVGQAAGPRNNDGATTGIAYKSNVHFIRACQDVVLDLSSERLGVKNALVTMGNMASVKVVSMSVGTPFYSSVLYDGVLFAHNNGKMLMAAAGTSFSWTSWWGVVYPAAHTQCVAITGVNESSNTCSSCHDGSQVDFTVPMERNANVNRTSLSLAQTGNGPKYIGGSSTATATAAGVAALVWSVDPGMSREDVLNYLTITSQYYPGSDSDTGYGNLDAGAAVEAAAGGL